MQVIAVSLTNALRSAGAHLTLELAAIGDDQSALEVACNNSPAIAARIGISSLPAMTWATIVMPLAVISPLVPKLVTLAKPKATASSLSDPVWRRRLESELAHASVNVAAVLETHEGTLESLTGLKVGDILPLEATVESHITLESEDVPLYACELGKQNGVLTVRIQSKLGGDGSTTNGPRARSQASKGSEPA